MNRYSTVNGEWSQKVVNSSLAPPLGSVLDNSGVQREGPIYDLLLPTLLTKWNQFMMNCAILYH